MPPIVVTYKGHDYRDVQAADCCYTQDSSLGSNQIHNALGLH